MNDMQHEQLFTDLSSEQTELVSGGRPFDDGGLSKGSLSIAALSKAAASAAKLQRQVLDFNTQIQGAAATSHTINGAAAAGTEAARELSKEIQYAAHG